MKIKEQTKKLAAGCSKHCFEVVDKTDEVSSKHCFEVADRADVVLRDFRRVLIHHNHRLNSLAFIHSLVSLVDIFQFIA